jgi:hypothetical protein
MHVRQVAIPHACPTIRTCPPPFSVGSGPIAITCSSVVPGVMAHSSFLFLSFILCFFASLFLCFCPSFFVSLFVCFFLSSFLSFFLSIYLSFSLSFFLCFFLSLILSFFLSFVVSHRGYLRDASLDTD